MADAVSAAALAVEAAMREAQQAEQRFLTMEQAALEAPAEQRPTGADVLAQRHESELSARRVEVARRRLTEAQTAGRLAGLRAVGQDIEALAAESEQPPAELVAAVGELAGAAARVRGICAAHDDRVRVLFQRARQLEVEPPNPFTGPEPSSARVAVSGNLNASWARHVAPPAVIHAGSSVSILGGSAGLAVAAAVAGDTAGALACIAPVTRQELHRPENMVISTTGDGQIIGYSQLTMAVAVGLKDGSLRPMTAAEIDHHFEARG